MSTRTDALVSQQETGKITASIIPVAAGYHRARASQRECCDFVPLVSSGKFARMRGILHSATLADPKAGLNEAQSEIEYWFEKSSSVGQRKKIGVGMDVDHVLEPD